MIRALSMNKKWLIVSHLATLNLVGLSLTDLEASGVLNKYQLIIKPALGNLISGRLVVYFKYFSYCLDFNETTLTACDLTDSSSKICDEEILWTGRKTFKC